ncbi:uncharacterized protein LOC131852083 [Achroia grisella]|uniref:uncharacterized protein LOC131852083 n=1 Tax=Achroia grisella TaxID=688607 RepID=UPI0027D2E0AF|nr:uncharacterized protein LOC131852083 [Achroia grisella]
MNKLLIVLLAVCLVNVHAFVKRDTAATASNDDVLKNLQKQFEETAKNIGTQFQSTFDAEKLKKELNDAIESISNTVSQLTKKNTSK